MQGRTTWSWLGISPTLRCPLWSPVDVVRRSHLEDGLRFDGSGSSPELALADVIDDIGMYYIALAVIAAGELLAAIRCSLAPTAVRERSIANYRYLLYAHPRRTIRALGAER